MNSRFRAIACVGFVCIPYDITCATMDAFIPISLEHNSHIVFRYIPTLLSRTKQKGYVITRVFLACSWTGPGWQFPDIFSLSQHTKRQSNLCSSENSSSAVLYSNLGYQPKNSYNGTYHIQLVYHTWIESPRSS